jgi:hypothetical protein
LYDEGFLGHGYALNDVQTRIPLVIANLPVVLREPVGQAALRDALGTALASPPGHGPAIATGEGPPVFQYLGTLDRPGQIGFTSRSGRTIYDFREGRFQFDGSEPRAPDALDARARRVFLDLVHTWERMMLARTDLVPSSSRVEPR